jgi:hypothetical protein
VKAGLIVFLGSLLLAPVHAAKAQDEALKLPKSIKAGSAFSIKNAGVGEATLYIIGPGQVLKRDVKAGDTEYFPAKSLYNAGHYVVILTQASGTQTGSFDVTPTSTPDKLSFLANPSRLPIGVRHGISGAVYVFDAYGNLITAPTPVSFEFSSPTGAVQKDHATTSLGRAWTEMDSTSQQGRSKFEARVGEVTSERIIRQVPGDPCTLKMRAQQSGQQLQLQTDPVRDCSGNAVPDGTIVTFTETYAGGQSTVDVPLKRDIAEVKMPLHSGARFTVASGVVLGNQIGWEK